MAAGGRKGPPLCSAYQIKEKLFQRRSIPMAEQMDAFSASSMADKRRLYRQMRTSTNGHYFPIVPVCL